MIWPRVSIILLLLVFAAHSEELPREFTVTPTEIKEPPAFLTQVLVPDASCAAISDAASILVVGHKSKNDKHLAVFHLDAGGLPNGEPTWITLPKPAALAANANYPLGLLFHPSLPLLYVWQDVNCPAANKQEKDPEFAKYLQFDHLVIYAIKDGTLKLLDTGARGAGFHCGLNSGTVGLDFAAKLLFVPNAAGPGFTEASIGFYGLDEEGLPINAPDDNPAEAEKKVQVVAATKETKKNPTGTAARLVRINRTLRGYPTGGGWFAGTEAVVMGGFGGCMVGDFSDGKLRQAWYNLPRNERNNCFIAGHPKLPALYLCLQDYYLIYQIAQSNGYLSLLPQQGTVPNAQFTGALVPLARHSRLAAGDKKSLHLLGLQSDGRLDGSDERLALPCADVKGLAYSEKHGRLYVAVDKAN